MKQLIHSLIRSTIYRYISHIKHSVTIFNFHQVSAAFDPKRHLTTTWTSLDKFIKAMRYLSNRYEFISLSEAQACLKNTLDKNYAVLTFDDGDSSLLEVMPILKKMQIPATFFINTDYLDDAQYSWVDALTYYKQNKIDAPQEVIKGLNLLRNTVNVNEYNKYRTIVEEYYNSFGLNLSKYLTTAQLFGINDTLFSIGLHGAEHERFGMMSREWNEQNIKRNYTILKEHPNYVPVIAFPFGKPNDWNNDAVSIALNLNLSIVLHNGGTNFHNSIMLNRIPSDGGSFSEAKLGLNLLT
ncbi:polysaccharide deacetylase family protein [Parabacteroides distasonis]|uniref:NodB homology domain-containing protein n=1 Tax=Parabacteroides distasonis (strain ATCC 8503 / DSM 20701 / CIP 104284 / JCM 5825 / NCTC 11152) TaxID=435591 RepID=A6LE34_PARD8|nr:polysaccharide deacetylase family protein [Parabacteroides distasonis]ABR43948.1 conserved hypothetical protein [Parabacteroides distasonis ATCC 8503]PNL07118.1 polysaccharide deacetylase family protein [Parabacteroides distasonis]QRO15891.1 polysaccharide deacetylase family protein [Parabacteroides distasonis]UEB09628.1 polysaccharide deacetylase family protein [Parabacteroides distasonis]